MKIYYTFLLFCLILTSCLEKNPNLDNITGEDELEKLEVTEPINSEAFVYNDIFYVPIYSDVYVDSQNQKNLLAATLSIRNTSFKHDLYISQINYFNTQGTLVRKFIDKSISLPPMGTVNYVIEKEDDTGGSGANFIVEVSAKSINVKPLIQAIMIGEQANKAFSFATDGYSVKE